MGNEVTETARQYGLTGAHRGTNGSVRGVWGVDANGIVTFVEVEWKDATESDEPPKNWAAIRERVIKRDGNCCKHCGSMDRLTVHHITPRPAGSHHPRNLVTLCASCHDEIEQPAVVLSMS